MALQTIEISQVQIDGDKEFNLADVAVRARVSALENNSAVSYLATIDVNEWSSNTNSISITTLKCGSEGTTPPIIFPVSNIIEYSLITNAVATPESGIVFTVPSDTTISNNIDICVVDFG